MHDAAAVLNAGALAASLLVLVYVIAREARTRHRHAYELQRADEYRAQFLANMSHELLTPLNSMLILAKQLAENRAGNLHEEQVEYAATIHAAGTHLLTLINDVLDRAKLDAGVLDVRSEPVVLARVLDELRDTFAPAAAQKRLALELTIEPEVPATIASDAARLHHILRSLLSNALKFTDHGAVTLTVARRGDELAFVVRDTGIGIAADQQRVIFEAFRQADGATTRRFGGTGLGLSISHELARLLGGRLRVDSAPGQGSAFTLTLPARATAERRPAPPDRDIAFAGKRILVVDDDLRNGLALEAILEPKGATIAIARNGREAVDYVRAHPEVDLVLMDIMMPEMDGLAATRELRKDIALATLPIIALTAKAMADDRQTCLEAGANDYIAKPLDVDKLLSIARVWIRK